MPVPCSGLGLGIPQAGRGQDGAAVAGTQLLQGARGAAGGHTWMVTVQPQVTVRPSLGGAGLCSLPSHDPGGSRAEGSGSGTGNRQGKWEQDSSTQGASCSHPCGLRCVWASDRFWFLQEQPMLCCVPILSEDSGVPAAIYPFPFALLYPVLFVVLLVQ